MNRHMTALLVLTAALTGGAAQVYTISGDDINGNTRVVTNVDFSGISSEVDPTVALTNRTLYVHGSTIDIPESGGGGGGGADTNTVLALVNASFAGGTNAVNATVADHTTAAGARDIADVAITNHVTSGYLAKEGTGENQIVRGEWYGDHWNIEVQDAKNANYSHAVEYSRGNTHNYFDIGFLNAGLTRPMFSTDNMATWRGLAFVDEITGGGADTNVVNDLIAEYDETNLTARIDAKVDAKYTWVRPGDWKIDYEITRATAYVDASYAETDDSYRVISNVVTITTPTMFGNAYTSSLDPNYEISTADAFFAVSQGITINASTGAFSAPSDGIYKIGARIGSATRYADVAMQIIGESNRTHVAFYADDVAGSKRKQVNDAAKLILDNATLMPSNQYVDAEGVVHKYAVYRTFQPRMTSAFAGNITPFAVSQHVLYSCKHYIPGIRYTGNQTFDDGQGHVSTITKLPWVDLEAWARTNGFTEAQIAYARIYDAMMIPCAKNADIPDGCIPYFMNETAAKRIFGESMRGVVAWSHVQDLTNAVPVVMVSDFKMKNSPWYYTKWKDPETGHYGFSRADICKRLEEMGLQYYVHSGDSGKPVFVNIDGNPVMLTTWGWGSSERGGAYGTSFVRAYDIIKAFVTKYGDTLKGIEE